MKFTKGKAKSNGKTIGIRFATGKPSVRYPSLEEFRRGLAVEFEHGSAGGAQTNVTGDDPIRTGRIALAHLRERPDYYRMLARYVEKRARGNPSVPVLRNGPWTLTGAAVLGRYFVFLYKNGKPHASVSYKTRKAALQKYAQWADTVCRSNHKR